VLGVLHVLAEAELAWVRLEQELQHAPLFGRELRIERSQREAILLGRRRRLGCVGLSPLRNAGGGHLCTIVPSAALQYSRRGELLPLLHSVRRAYCQGVAGSLSRAVDDRARHSFLVFSWQPRKVCAAACGGASGDSSHRAGDAERRDGNDTSDFGKVTRAAHILAFHARRISDGATDECTHRPGNEKARGAAGEGRLGFVELLNSPSHDGGFRAPRPHRASRRAS